MKNIAAQMVNFDREQMRRIANNMPEQYDEKPQVTALRHPRYRSLRHRLPVRQRYAGNW